MTRAAKESDAARYAAQRRKGFAGLQFVAGLESEYREFRAPIVRTRLKSLFQLAAFGLFAYLLVDRLAPQPMMSRNSVAWLLVSIGVIALLIPATRRAVRAQQLDTRVAVGLALFGLCTVASVLAGGPRMPTSGITMTLVVLYFVAGIPVRKAALAALAISLVYIVGVLAIPGQDPQSLGYRLLAIVLTNAVGLLGEYHIEYEARRSFLLHMELRDLAQHDGMTRLLNRRSFRRQLKALWRQAARDGRPVGLMLVDMDHLKEINDRDGHMVGDRCLRAIASVLRNNAHRPLDIAGRIGGDEFAVALYDTDADGFMRIAHAIRADLRRSTREQNELPYFSVSIGGVHFWPRLGLPVNEALRVVDDRLYMAKRDGRDGAKIDYERPPVPKPSAPLPAEVDA